MQNEENMVEIPQPSIIKSLDTLISERDSLIAQKLSVASGYQTEIDNLNTIITQARANGKKTKAEINAEKVIEQQQVEDTNKTTIE